MSQESEDTPTLRREARAEAIILVAEDELSDEEIAAHLHIDRKTLHRWKIRPEFAAKVAAARAAFYARALEENIAVRAQRVAWKAQRHAALRRIVRARGADPGMAHVPGGTTGFVIRQYKMAPGSRAGLREEFVVDTSTSAEMRALEKEAAQDLGQWVDKGELTGKGGGPLIVSRGPDLALLSGEELAALERVVARLADPALPVGEHPGGEGPPEPA